ncbi:MAG: PilZ domain-containing protein [Anaerolineae bacterium]|nr:PilZ domain-containing protein [Phycisphaerae bacterium]
MKLSVQDFAEIVGALRGEGNNLGAHEKRRAVRMEVNSKLVVGVLNDGVIGRKYSVLTRDISLAGIGLLQSIALQQKQEFVLSLPRQHGKPPLFFVTVVMHCRPLADGLYGLGCEFVRQAPPEMGQKLIQDESNEHARIRNSVLA